MSHLNIFFVCYINCDCLYYYFLFYVAFRLKQSKIVRTVADNYCITVIMTENNLLIVKNDFIDLYNHLIIIIK